MESDEKSPSVAVLLSLGITTGGVVTMLSGGSSDMKMLGFGAMFVGPSTGQWYAGEVGGLGLVARGAGFASMIYGFSEMLQSETDCEPGVDCTAEQDRAQSAGRRGALFFVGGVSLWVGSTIMDIALAKRAADRWNEQHHVSIAPLAYASDGHHVTGLALSARF